VAELSLEEQDIVSKNTLLGWVGAVASTWAGTFGRFGDWGSESSEE
jgi:hypothetical protein